MLERLATDGGPGDVLRAGPLGRGRAARRPPYRRRRPPRRQPHPSPCAHDVIDPTWSRGGRARRRGGDPARPRRGNPQPWFRCPFGDGMDDPAVLAGLDRLGYRSVGWDVDALDWQAPMRRARPSSAASSRAPSSAEIGAVVLQHPWTRATSRAPGTGHRRASAPRARMFVRVDALPRLGAPDRGDALVRPRRRRRQLEDRCRPGRTLTARLLAAVRGPIKLAPGRWARARDGGAPGPGGARPAPTPALPRTPVPPWSPPGTRWRARTRRPICACSRTRWGRAGFAPRNVLRNDTIGVLRAGTDRGWGVAVHLRGGRQRRRDRPRWPVRPTRCAWRHLGDWGGGTDVGWAGLAAAVRLRDGRGPRTALAERVPRHFGKASPARAGPGVLRRTDRRATRARALAAGLRGGRARVMRSLAASSIVWRTSSWRWRRPMLRRLRLTRLGCGDRVGRWCLPSDRPRVLRADRRRRRGGRATRPAGPTRGAAGRRRCIDRPRCAGWRHPGHRRDRRARSGRPASVGRRDRPDTSRAPPAVASRSWARRVSNRSQASGTMISAAMTPTTTAPRPCCRPLPVSGKIRCRGRWRPGRTGRRRARPRSPLRLGVSHDQRLPARRLTASSACEISMPEVERRPPAAGPVG